MDLNRVISLVATVALVLGYAVGSAWWVSTGDAWYQGLNQPRWQPPDVVFGLIWPYNFAALIAAGGAISAHGTSTVRTIWLVGLAGSIVAALAWARLFYVSHELWAAAIALIVAVVVTVPILAVAFVARTWAGLVLIPYQIWLGLAASLSIGYARLN
jgi:benzodiazapine receptor